jgi:hypothetical protein
VPARCASDDAVTPPEETTSNASVNLHRWPQGTLAHNHLSTFCYQDESRIAVLNNGV